MAMRLPTVGSSQITTNSCSGTLVENTKDRVTKERKRLPKWFKTSLPIGKSQSIYNTTMASVKDNDLNTVCVEARCPNIHDCWGRGTATFMIAGDVCTRGCRFCAVKTSRVPPPLNPDEPEDLATAIERMGINHAVITVVNRDDLPDGGASHYRRCIMAVHDRCPDVGIELLCSDLDGNLESLKILLNGLPIRVFAHNVECVPRLDKIVRDRRASFTQSLKILSEAKNLRPDLKTKTSIMVGIGETDSEVIEAMKMIRSSKVDMITLGQYLQPGGRHLPVDRFPEPSQFADWDKEAREMGFSAVASGPLVRSSYRAGLLLEEAMGLEPVVTRESTGSAVSHLTFSPAKEAKRYEC
tara:strand:+ start:959 stop:2023 length:1065 start_codon:yes stop_codon:yes gene_type:complete